MSGDTDNASLWADADVYIAPLGSPIPADVDTNFSAAWDLVGLLDGDAGFIEARTWDKSDHFAWGDILVRTGRKNFKLTKKFTALEDNEVTAALMWPGSPGGVLKTPRPDRILIAFETTEGDTKRRVISAHQVEVDLVDDINENESDLTKYAFEATIFPNAAGDYWIVQPGYPGS